MTDVGDNPLQGDPEDLRSFAWVQDFEGAVSDLASIGEAEDWDYHNAQSEKPMPILRNYIVHTYRRLAEEGKIARSQDGQWACFNTGLVTVHQEPVYAVFDKNYNPERQPWRFKYWARRGEASLNRFPELPDIAQYFDDPSCLVLDIRKDFRQNIEHIIAENRDRFPEPYRAMGDYSLQVILKGSIENAKERVRRNYKTAIPQYYWGQVQLLLPLCLGDPQKADLALVVERHDTFYRATTCLTLDMAYNNSRQITRPDRDWLKP
ncbi:MAG TPA: DUF3825 domain-containing protein [Candidatus Acidoferrum sp.]|nr:DUF3825 domain-containing protein [Candidatus Acidoferrum sp.]